MVDSGEADYLVPERVWQEFAKGLAEPQPGEMFEVLRQSGLLQKLLPEIEALPEELRRLRCRRASRCSPGRWRKRR